MKSNYKFMLTAVGAFALGALAIQALHAQMKPPAYFVAEVNVKAPHPTPPQIASESYSANQITNATILLH